MELSVTKFDSLNVRELYQILRLRSQVFVLEQECLYQDLDDLDQPSWHVMLKDADKLVACARVFHRNQKEGVAQIGRMVTAMEYRRMAKGSEVMQKAMEVAFNELNAQTIYIEAQVYAIPFYENLGFKVASEEFLEDGIPHVQMIAKR